MITDEQKIAFYDLFNKKIKEFFDEQENVNNTIWDLSYIIPSVIEDMLWYFVYTNYGRENPWQNDFIDTLTKKEKKP